MKNAKKLVISIATIILVAFVALSFLIYDASEAVAIIGVEGSYAEAFAKENKIQFINIYDSENPDVEIPIPNKDDQDEENDTQDTDNNESNENPQKENAEFSYNYEDETVNITAYKGNSRYVLIPQTIDGLPVKTVSMQVLKRGIVVVLIPESVTSITSDFISGRYTPGFFVAIAMMAAGYIFAIFATLLGFKKNETAEDTFYGIPFIYSGLSTLIVVTVWSALSIILGFTELLELIGMILILAIALGKLLKKSAARELVVERGEQIKAQTAFIKSLTVEAETLTARAKSDELKAVSKKVYEVIRYSDPMSNEALADIENKIQNEFNSFDDAVITEDAELANEIADELISLINERNKMTKILK